MLICVSKSQWWHPQLSCFVGNLRYSVYRPRGRRNQKIFTFRELYFSKKIHRGTNVEGGFTFFSLKLDSEWNVYTILPDFKTHMRRNPSLYTGELSLSLSLILTHALSLDGNEFSASFNVVSKNMWAAVHATNFSLISVARYICTLHQLHSCPLRS